MKKLLAIATVLLLAAQPAAADDWDSFAA